MTPVHIHVFLEEKAYYIRRSAIQACMVGEGEEDLVSGVLGKIHQEAKEVPQKEKVRYVGLPKLWMCREYAMTESMLERVMLTLFTSKDPSLTLSIHPHEGVYVVGSVSVTLLKGMEQGIGEEEDDYNDNNNEDKGDGAQSFKSWARCYRALESLGCRVGTEGKATCSTVKVGQPPLSYVSLSPRSDCMILILEFLDPVDESIGMDVQPTAKYLL